MGAAASIVPPHSRRLKESAANSSSIVHPAWDRGSQPIKVVLRIYACKRRVYATPTVNLTLARPPATGSILLVERPAIGVTVAFVVAVLYGQKRLMRRLSA